MLYDDDMALDDEIEEEEVSPVIKANSKRLDINN